ncbi:MAG: lactate utilization protein [Oscillospiraceae bacterium]|nr:lactate utilization protein [Oscillospiraceae bacterium]
MDREKTIANLRKNGFEVTEMETSAQAAAYIGQALRGKTVGIGGSMTVRGLNIYDHIKENNTVFWHMIVPGDETMVQASSAQVYITSANAISEEGYVINIDGRGNRVAGTLMKKDKVYLIVGKNKLCGPFSEALERARNVAGPLNAKRLETKTPCAVTGHCHDCVSPDRICNALVVLWRKPFWCDSMEIVLVDEELGY